MVLGLRDLRWFWSLTVDPPMARSDRLRRSFRRAGTSWKGWAKLEEVPYLRLARLLRCPTGADFL